MKKLAVVAVCGLALVGCGGSNDDDQDNSAGAPGIIQNGNSAEFYPLKTTIRQYQLGDEWIYQVSGDASGTMLRTISAELKNDSQKLCRAESSSFDLVSAGAPISLTTTRLLSQDLPGSVFDCGKGDAASPVFTVNSLTAPQGLALDLYSPMAIGLITSRLRGYSDGSVRDCTFTVLGKETLSLPAGKFETFKIREVCSDDGGAATDAFSWLAPHIGEVRRQFTLATTAGVANVTLELSSFTLLDASQALPQNPAPA